MVNYLRVYGEVNMEVSLGKRCCCCIPMRYGLMIWGYLKLVAAGTLFGIILYIMSQMGVTSLYILAAVVLLLTIGFTIAFIYAVHKRNYKLLTVYYYCSIIENVLGVLFIGGLIVILVALNASGLLVFFIVVYTVPLIIVTFLAVVFQTYIIILLRDAVNKIQERDYYKNLNNMYDDEYYM